MKKILKFLDNYYPTLILIAFWFYYENWLLFNHGVISSVIGIFNNTIERPYQTDTVSGGIYYCIFFAVLKTVVNHIPAFFTVFIIKYIAKSFPAFNKKAFIILFIATVVSFILVFCLGLYCELWWNRVI
ncbi:MAG: hypothetical protein LKJ13_03355 [Clostridia bacterium]|jgi:hypothetical protein|nr:hypothetical protein [Clostridia bacterium]MCI2000884.1 hypothetical protein [Clostridia bacterium]MCI2015668.1 hypothetical protein [Clostridia bacterium]